MTDPTSDTNTLQVPWAFSSVAISRIQSNAMRRRFECLLVGRHSFGFQRFGI